MSDFSVVGARSSIGRSGLNRFGGYVFEDFLPYLTMPYSLKIYKEMSMNDPTIGSIIFAADQLIKNTSWRVETEGTSNIELEAKEFINECMHDMSFSWIDTIAEILSMFVYGWSWHEIIYKYRGGNVRDPKKKSKYNDGKIGWRKIAGRSQDTWEEWLFKEDSVVGMVQSSPPDFNSVKIPLEKSLLFRTRVDRDNPEGRSLLRNAYRPWFFKKHIEEIEGIGIERDLAGLPVLTPPPDINLWDTDNQDAVRLKEYAENMVRNIRRDQNEGVVLPNGWDLTLLSSQSARQFDTNAILNRYDQRIAMTMLADLVLLGSSREGSFALADAKKGLLASALDAQLKSIAEVFNNKAIPKLLHLNGYSDDIITPILKPSSVSVPKLTELARYITALSGANFPLLNDENLEEYLRHVGGLPMKSAEATAGEENEDSSGDTTTDSYDSVWDEVHREGK